ncbi:MAG TPA: hypothetical protein VF414_12370 [Thermoanaerobaculia bacterium]
MSLLLLSIAFLSLVSPAGQAPAAQTEPAPPGVDQASPVAPPEAKVDAAAYEGALTGAIDGSDFLETPGYRRMLELVGRYGKEEIASKVERELDFAASTAAPEDWRGRIVHLRGIVAGLEAVRLVEPLNGRRDAYRAIVCETDGSEGVVVDFLEPPPELKVSLDVIDVEGVFYRTVGYESRKGVHQLAPYLIARDIRLMPPETAKRSTNLDILGKLLVGAAVVLVVVRVLSSMRGRSGRKARLEAEERSRLLRERAMSATKRLPNQP